MEFFAHAEMCAPVSQVFLLLLLSTIALLFGKVRLALLINYLFTLYWGYVFDRTYIFSFGSARISYFPWIYFGFGLLIFLIAVFAFLYHRD